MTILFFVATLLSISTKAYEYELVVQQDDCYFTKDTIISTGNEGAPSDPCYSKLGTIRDNKEDYRDDEGKFAFRLTYGDTIELIWTQTSWIEDATLVGADLSDMPHQTSGPSDGQYFHGLGLNTGEPNWSYLDGSPGTTHGNWYCAVLSYQPWNDGIPAFNGAVVQKSKLEILVPTCDLSTNDVCAAIELNANRINGGSIRIDDVETAVNARIDGVDTRIDGVDSRIGGVDTSLNTLGTRIDTTNGRIDTLRDYLQGANADAAHAFNGNVFDDSKNVADGAFEFSKTELLLLGMNLLTIVIGLFICWRGGVFEKNRKQYAKVSGYYESEDVDKPINA